MSTKRRTPLRKAQCSDCGYVIRVTRSWLEVGLPTCPCGGTIAPTEASDMAFCGLLGPDDMPSPMWTVICRENGWEDSILRRGAAAKAFDRRMLEAGGIMARSAGKPQCAYAGCGKWVSAGSELCPDHNHETVELDAQPF